jgi:hypothetical protein
MRIVLPVPIAPFDHDLIEPVGILDIRQVPRALNHEELPR